MNKNLNILMVYPLNPGGFWDMRYTTNILGKKSFNPPLGLLTVAALLPKEWNIRIVDLNVTSLSEEDFDFADYLFLTGMIVQEESFCNVAQEFQSRGIPVIAGGPFATLSYKEITCVDCFIIGEAENTVPFLVDDIVNKGVIKKMYQSNEFPDLTLSPVPRYELINIDDYLSVPMEISRGCPHNCEFCAVTVMMGKKTRYKTSTRVIEQLAAIYQSGHRGMIFIIDDNLAGNFKQTKKILSEIINWQSEHEFPFVFAAQATINIAKDSELLKLLNLARFETIFFGIETPSEKALQETRKTQNLNLSLTEAVNIVHKHGIAVASGFILGFDSDDETIFDRQIKFVTQTAIARPIFGLLGAMPGTRLTERLERENRVLFRSDGTNEYRTNIKTLISEEKLLQGYLKILEHIWAPKNYFDRLVRSLEMMNDHRFVFGKKLTSKDLFTTASFLRTILTSWYYKEFLVYLFKSRKRKIPFKAAIAAHFRGHHYLKYNRDIAIPKIKKALAKS